MLRNSFSVIGGGEEGLEDHSVCLLCCSVQFFRGELQTRLHFFWANPVVCADPVGTFPEKALAFPSFPESRKSVAQKSFACGQATELMAWLVAWTLWVTFFQKGVSNLQTKPSHHWETRI